MRILSIFLLATVALAQSARYPSSVATWSDVLVAHSGNPSALTAVVSPTALSIPVFDGSQFSANSAVQVDEEIIKLCGISGNSLVVCSSGRGYGGTTAAGHTTGALVHNSISVPFHNNLAAEIIAIESALGANLSNVPSSGGGGAGAISSVFGRTGVVTSQAGDYSTAQVTESGNLYFTNARVLSAMAGLYQAVITGAPGAWPTFATVATSGSYTDLSNKPTILTNPMTTAGDLLVGGAGGAFARLATPGNGTYCPSWSGGVITLITCPGAGGGISWIGLTAPSGFTVTGSPLTANGTIGISLATQAASYALIAPTAGGMPTWRTIQAQDLIYTSLLTGGVARTQATKNAETVSVQDFGAVCDGTASSGTDNAAAVLAAITAVPSTGTVLFPSAGCSGGYVVGPLGTITKLVTLDFGGSVIYPKANAVAGMTIGYVSPIGHVTFKNGIFKPYTSYTPTDVIVLDGGPQDTVFDGLTFQGLVASHSVVYNKASYGFVQKHVRYNSNSAPSTLYYAYRFSDAGNYYTLAARIEDTDFSGVATGRCIGIEGGELTIQGGVVESCAGGGIEYFGDTAGTGATMNLSMLDLDSVHFEENSSFNLKTPPTYAPNYFQANIRSTGSTYTTTTSLPLMTMGGMTNLLLDGGWSNTGCITGNPADMNGTVTAFNFEIQSVTGTCDATVKGLIDSSISGVLARQGSFHSQLYSDFMGFAVLAPYQMRQLSSTAGSKIVSFRSDTNAEVATVTREGNFTGNWIGSINGVSLASLGTGVLKNTTSTGAPSIVSGTGTNCVHVDGTSAACGSGGGTIASTSSVLKGDGSGNAVAASAGSDYQAPLGYTAENIANKDTNGGYVGRASDGSASAPGGFRSLGSGSGTMALSGSTSGTVTQTVQAAAGTWSFAWPIAVAASHQWLTTDTSGNGSFTQPAFSDISGSVVAAQLPNPGASSLGGVESVDCTGTGHILKISTAGVPSCSADAGGGSMVYPAGSGVPIVASGASWGTTLAPTGGGSYIPTVSSASTFITSTGTNYTFPLYNGTLAMTTLSQSWSGVQTFDPGTLVLSGGGGGAAQITPGADYYYSNDGTLISTNVPNKGFGTSSTPFIYEVYNSAGGAGTGAKLGTLPQHFSTGGSNTNTAVSAFNLAAAPGSTVGQMWEVSGTIVFTGAITCTAGTFAATVTWTDGRGSNSYSPVSVAYGSLSSAAASGTTLGGQYNFSFQFIQRSSAAPTFSTTLPTCTALPYDWFVSARRIG